MEEVCPIAHKLGYYLRVSDKLSESLALWGRGNILSCQHMHSLTEHKVPVTHTGAIFQLLGWVTGICMNAGFR